MYLLLGVPLHISTHGLQKHHDTVFKVLIQVNVREDRLWASIEGNNFAVAKVSNKSPSAVIEQLSFPLPAQLLVGPKAHNICTAILAMPNFDRTKDPTFVGHMAACIRLQAQYFLGSAHPCQVRLVGDVIIRSAGDKVQKILLDETHLQGRIAHIGSRRWHSSSGQAQGNPLAMYQSLLQW